MLATDWTVLVFRLIHITAGVWWVGSIYLFVVFIQPSARSIGPAGAPFMTELVGKRKLPTRLLELAGVTIAAGLFFYWIDWHDAASLGDFAKRGFGLGSRWVRSSAITAFLIGLLATRPTASRFMALAGQVAASGGPPSPKVGLQLQQLQAKLTTYAKLNLVFVTIAVICMGTARYW